MRGKYSLEARDIPGELRRVEMGNLVEDGVNDSRWRRVWITFFAFGSLALT